MFNKNIIDNRVTQSISRRPNIYIQNDKEKKAYIIDVTMVKDNNYFRSYCNKIIKYKPLQEKKNKKYQICKNNSSGNNN